MSTIKKIEDNDLKDFDLVKFFCPNCNKISLFKIIFSQEGITGSCCKCDKWLVLKKDENYIPQQSSTHLTVTCPYCQSTDTKKITNTSKAVHTALFGMFAMSRNAKQWHCNNCNSDF